MTLWDLLTFGAGAAAFGGGLYEVNLARAAAGSGYYAALAFVLLLACGCVTTIRAVGLIVFKKLLEAERAKSLPAYRLELSGRVVYAVAAMWCVASPFVAALCTRQFVAFLR